VDTPSADRYRLAPKGGFSPIKYADEGQKSMGSNAVSLTQDIVRPPAAWASALQAIGTATASGTLHNMGIRDTFIQGPVAWTKGHAIAGPALTLQFMPLREDLYGEGEYADPEKQLHRHALYHARPGDIVVVDARGDMRSGIFGEMMLTYFKGRGGAGVVIDGCIRDYPHCKSLNLGLWIRGVTPNFHTQTGLMPFAVNTPIACGGVTVMPGDIIVADDDGAAVVPAALALEVIEKASILHGWEDFSRQRLLEGGSLQRYYPLSDEARPEYEAWCKTHPAKSPG
jgi:regulator of RNase E activity RraA